MFGSREFWGIDIGGSSVKGVKIRRKGEELEVAAADVVPLKGEPTAEASFGRDRRIWIALHELARRNRIKSQPVVISVPTRATFVRPFDLLLVTGKPTEELIELEVQQHIPFGLDSVIWDHELFPPTENTPADKNREGVLFAVKREVINNYVMSLSAAGLNADDIQCAPLALYNYVRHDVDFEEPTLIMDVGATCTDLVMLHEGRYTISSIPSGGDNMTKVLEERFNVSPEQADKAKRMVGKLKNARRVLEALLPAMRRYVGEVENAVRRFHAGTGGLHPKKILLFGGSADTVGLARMISQTLDCEVITPKQLNKLNVAPDCNIDLIGSRFSEFGVALGLALQAAGEAHCDISLVSAEATRQSAVTRSKPAAAAILATVAVMFAWLGFFGDYKTNQLAEAGEVLAARIAPIEELNEEYQDLRRKQNQIESGLAKFEEISEDREAITGILNIISAQLPAANRSRGNDLEKVWLLHVEINTRGGDMVEVVTWWGIRARRDRRNDVEFAESAVLNNLEVAGGFSNVRMAAQGERDSELGQRYVNNLSPTAKSEEGGSYMVFPVSFTVDPQSLNGGGG